jgi:hypothetical protein
MCFAATRRLQGRAAKPLLARRKSWCNEGPVQICLAANGPAIKGGCVTWRSTEQKSWKLAENFLESR